jgi:MoaA/NifB/PqqE/SkfB family radical SAM enzyme
VTRTGAGSNRVQVRTTAAGIHLFERDTGLNVLLDEVPARLERYSVAPRYISIALTNACELRCAYCYAPKYRAALDAAQILQWAVELDGAGCLGIGFGGGEPTSYPGFSDLCAAITSSTAMAVTFTTHGHCLDEDLADALRGSVHFARLSVDGVGATYERLRGRPFRAVTAAAHLLGSIAPFGVNSVVNRDTIGELDDIAQFAADAGAEELLLLPEQTTRATPGICDTDSARLVRWIGEAKFPLRLAISRSGLEALLPTAEPIAGEDPLDAHLHIDATGTVRPHAYSDDGVSAGASILVAASTLKEMT